MVAPCECVNIDIDNNPNIFAPILPDSTIKALFNIFLKLNCVVKLNNLLL